MPRLMPPVLQNHVTTSRLGSTLIEAGGDAVGGGELELLVIEPDRVDVVRLTLPGTLRIGRGADHVDLKLRDPKVSRPHVILHVAPPLVELEHVAPDNRTEYAGRALSANERVRFEEGQNARIGDTVLLLQRAPKIRHRRAMWGHAYFLARLGEECERARDLGARFSVVRTRIPGGHGAALAWAQSLPPNVIVAAYGGDHYELLVVGVKSAGAPDLERELDALLGSPERPRGAALFPEDGMSADALLDTASQRLTRTTREHRAPAVPASGELARLYRRAQIVAGSRVARVLILGETGAGKTLIARRIHEQSSRRDEPFLALNCASLKPELAESELFGHERGTFTGAGHRDGIFKQLDGGTLLLDDIDTLSLEVQGKLLTALENDQLTQVRPIGSARSFDVDVRVIAATNKDVARTSRAGVFRADLWNRLAGFVLSVPPLRSWGEELPRLMREFLHEFGELEGKPRLELSAAAEELLKSYTWPGNVRELRTVVRRAVVLCENQRIEVDDLELVQDEGLDALSVEAPDDIDSLSRAEAKELISRALLASGCVKEKAARLLKIRKETLLAKMDEVGLPRPRAKG